MFLNANRLQYKSVCIIIINTEVCSGRNLPITAAHAK